MHKLFLLDSLGAVLSAILLGVVLVRLEAHVGMPAKVLYPLSFTAGAFALYSGFCYLLRPSDAGMFLRAIAMGNWLYCVVTLVLVIIHFHQLTTLGLAYFLIEMLLVTLLATWEWRTAKSQ